MMRLAAVLIAIGLLLGFSGLAIAGIGETMTGLPVSVEAGKSVTLNVPGASAAYSLNASVADASAENGVVEIRGIGGGSTGVVIVLPDSTRTLVVTVPFPRGAQPPPRSGGITAQESGSVESSYSSTSGQVNTVLHMQRREGEGYRRFWLVTQTFVSPQSGRGTGFPLLSYEIGGDGHSVTLLDESVSVSPLTFTDSLIRGIHVADRRWSVHAGASSVAQFGGYLFPANPQWVLGVTRTLASSSRTRLEANLYDIVNSGGQQSTAGGTLGTLVYRDTPNPHLSLLGEVGLSRSFAFDAQAHYTDDVQDADFSILERPANFATLATNAQQGFFADADYLRRFSPRLSISAAAQSSRYAFTGSSQRLFTAQGNASYALSPGLSMSGGVQYSQLGTRSLSMPISLQAHAGHFTADAQYQPTSNLQGSFASGYGFDVGVATDRIAASAFYRHNVDIPTLSSALDAVPGLQAALNQAGISLATPAQLQALLGNADLLARLGFSNLSLDLAPSRNDMGLNAMWSSRGGTRHLTFNYLRSAARLVNGNASNFAITSLTYSARLDARSDLSASIAMLQSRPTYNITITRRLSSVPALLFPSKRGAIDGYVFRDDAGNATREGALPLPNVSVALDDGRMVLTGPDGHYVFGGVPYGEHKVQAVLPAGAFFTTASPADAQIGDHVDIGISFVQGRLFGTVVNDAGLPMDGVVVTIGELGKNLTAGNDGAFALGGVPPGTYTLMISPDSLPPGYDLAELQPAVVRVQAQAPASADLVVRALRSVAGTVTVYDRRKGTTQPAAGIDVVIRQLGLRSRTDENGAYAFRNLPAGTFTIEVDGGGPTERRAVTLSPQPVTLTGIDFRATVDQMLQRQRSEHRSPGGSGRD